MVRRFRSVGEGPIRAVAGAGTVAYDFITLSMMMRLSYFTFLKYKLMCSGRVHAISMQIVCYIERQDALL